MRTLPAMCIGRVLLALMLVLVSVAGTSAAKRAFVVGMDEYSDPDLRLSGKPVNDARSIAQTFKNIDGFETVEIATDLTKSELLASFDRFLATVQSGDTVVFYFSGHGTELDGDNWLAATDATLISSDMGVTQRRGEVEAHALSLRRVMNELEEKGAQTKVLIIDACREDLRQATKGGIGASGLNALVMDPTPQTFILYAAAARQKALACLSRSRDCQGDPDPNSLFTRKLLPLLAEPGLTIEEIASQVKGEVESAAASIGHNQRPTAVNELSTRLPPVIFREKEEAVSDPDIEQELALAKQGSSKPVLSLPSVSENPQLANPESDRRDSTAYPEQHSKKIRSIETTEGARYAGSGFTDFTGLTRDQCKSACLSNSLCKAFTYNIVVGWCSLKSEIGMLEPFNNAVAGKVLFKDGPDPSKSIEIVGDKNYFGFDLTSSPNVTLDECKTICLSDPLCKAITYNEGAKWCFLKSDIGKLEPFNGSIAGKVVSESAQDLISGDQLASSATLAGMTISELDHAARTKFGILADVSGLVVINVAPNSEAAGRGVTAGEVITEIAQESVSSTAEMRDRIKDLKEQGRKNALIMLASKNGDLRFVTVRMD